MNEKLKFLLAILLLVACIFLYFKFLIPFIDYVYFGLGEAFVTFFSETFDYLFKNLTFKWINKGKEDFSIVSQGFDILTNRKFPLTFIEFLKVLGIIFVYLLKGFFKMFLFIVLFPLALFFIGVILLPGLFFIAIVTNFFIKFFFIRGVIVDVSFLRLFDAIFPASISQILKSSCFEAFLRITVYFSEVFKDKQTVLVEHIIPFLDDYIHFSNFKVSNVISWSSVFNSDMDFILDLELEHFISCFFIIYIFYFFFKIYLYLAFNLFFVRLWNFPRFFSEKIMPKFLYILSKSINKVLTFIKNLISKIKKNL